MVFNVCWKWTKWVLGSFLLIIGQVFYLFKISLFTRLPRRRIKRRNRKMQQRSRARQNARLLLLYFLFFFELAENGRFCLLFIFFIFVPQWSFCIMPLSAVKLHSHWFLVICCFWLNHYLNYFDSLGFNSLCYVLLPIWFYLWF